MPQTKTLFITGCSSGLGRALCHAALDKGYRVVATGRELSRLPEPSERLLPLTLDVNNRQQMQAAVTQAVAWSGQIDVLINNAGYGQMGPLLELESDRLALQMRTNLLAPLQLIQMVVPHMPRHTASCIINIGSISATLSTPFAGAYCASKAALQSVSDALRMELKPLGIHLITVQAGAIASAFASNANQALPSLTGEYQQLAAQVRSRADASQAKPTPAAQVAETILAELDKSRPANRLRVGYGARLYPLLAKLPSRVSDWILCRRFGLNSRFESK